MAPARHTVRTIAVTAAVTSAAWAVAGALWLDRAMSNLPRAAPDSFSAMPSGERQPRAPSQAQPLADSAKPAYASSSIARRDDRLEIPVVGIRADQLVDTFTQSRAEGSRMHDAIDIPAPRGTPVVAAAAGRVEKLFLSKAGGLTVYVRAPDGARLYYYAHLDAYAPGLAEGQDVVAGSGLGTVGSSGNADPSVPHLHFAILQTEPKAAWWEPSTAINPYPLLGGRG